MRTGNAIFDVLVRVVAIALIAAIIVWILGILHAPSIVGTVIWILALLAIVAVIFPLVVRGGGFAARDRPHDRSADPTVPGARPRPEEPTAPTRSEPSHADQPTSPTRPPPPPP